MTQGIKDFLNLPSMEDVMKEHGIEIPDIKEIEDNSQFDYEINELLNQSNLMTTVEMAQQAQDRLDMVSGKDHSESMDAVFKETLKHAQDLIDFGYNIDLRSARGIFEVATAMYGRAIEAKNSKRDAQLKAIKLALDQRKLDLDERKLKGEDHTIIPGEATVIREDRNELIKSMRERRLKE